MSFSFFTDGSKTEQTIEKHNQTFDSTNPTNFKHKIEYDSNEDSQDKMEIDINGVNDDADTFPSHQFSHNSSTISLQRSDSGTNVSQVYDQENMCAKTFLFQPQPVSQIRNKIEFNFKCEQCSKEFMTEFFLAQHLREHTYNDGLNHGTILSTNPIVPFVENLQCKKCGMTLKTKTSYQRHISKYCETHRYHCYKCEQIFKSDFLFIEHNTEMHADYDNFICKKCGVQFKKERPLTLHLKRCFISRSFECSMCAKIFRSKQYLLKHMDIVHFNPKYIKCDNCDKYFTDKRNLKTHKNAIHNNPTSWECKRCGKVLRTRQTLYNHMANVHFGIYKFECDVCGRTFKSKHCLTMHISAHNSVNDLRCDVCGKAFLNKVSLSRHVNIHNTHDTYFADVLKYEKLRYQN